MIERVHLYGAAVFFRPTILSYSTHGLSRRQGSRGSTSMMSGGGAGGGRGMNADFHATTWRNLQYLRGTLHGMMSGLQAAIDNGGIVDQQVATDINRLAQEDDLYA